MSENNHKPPEKKEVQKRADAKLISGDVDKDECMVIGAMVIGAGQMVPGNLSLFASLTK